MLTKRNQNLLVVACNGENNGKNFFVFPKSGCGCKLKWEKLHMRDFK